MVERTYTCETCGFEGNIDHKCKRGKPVGPPITIYKDNSNRSNNKDNNCKGAKLKIFTNDKGRIKQALMEEATNFCEMIDCIDEPSGLDYSVTKYGVTLNISASMVE